MTVSRRAFLRSAAVVSGAAGAGLTAQAWGQATQPAASGLATAEVELAPLPFVHGVASGDPLEDAVVIWTRVTPDEAAWPGTGLGAPTPLRWEVALDPEFARIVQSGEVVSSAERDHCVHVDVRGLAPDTVYYYRFEVVAGPHVGVGSSVGRTRTSPRKNAHIERARWAVASCANWESGFFSAYEDMARRGWAGDLDLCVFLGDYIYEYAQYEYAGFGPVRLHAPAHETVSLQDYRTRYGRYRTDPALQAAHGAMPWIVVWDDHEVANNNWREGADNHSALEGSFAQRRDAAVRAYFEWMPVRVSGMSEEGRIYRSFTFGDLVELTIMDLRTYRDVEFWRGGSRQADGRTMLGSEQYDWLIGTLQGSTARWNALGNSVMFSPMRLGAVMRNPATRPIAKAMSSNILSSAADADVPSYDELPLNGDQWDGYDVERRRLLSELVRLGKAPVFLTGDIHTEWAHDVVVDGAAIGCEIVCSSVTAPNVTDALRLPAGHPMMRTAVGYMFAANPSLRHCALDTHGYSVVTFGRDAVLAEWVRVDNILDPASAVRTGAALVWQPGTGFAGL